MTLNGLICRANSIYTDDAILQCWDVSRAKPRLNPTGDTLAMFVCSEIASGFDPDAGDEEQIRTATEAIRHAADELAAVAHSLERLENERLAA